MTTQWKTPTGRPHHFSVVSLFAGCGGLDLGFLGGFRYSGKYVSPLLFEIVAAYDHDERCEETYRHNIGDHFKKVDLSRAKITSMPSADVLIGGFPCQEFSICGPKKGVTSSRGKLYRSLVNYAKNHRPMVVVAENVFHLLKLNDGKDLRKILGDFRRVGYRTQVWRMNAADYGVPQSRNRLFIIGTRADIDGAPVQPVASFHNRHRSIDWAINDLEHVTDDSVPNQSQYFRAARAGSGHGQGDETSHRDRPGYTVRANAHSRVQFHYKLKRRLTVRECARLQTFPDSFVFPHFATSNIMQIGNAVPPLLANRVAKSVYEFLSQMSDTTAIGKVQ